MSQLLSRHFRGEITDLRRADPREPARPDDLDLGALARLAQNYLRGNPDPARHYECKYFRFQKAHIALMYPYDQLPVG